SDKPYLLIVPVNYGDVVAVVELVADAPLAPDVPRLEALTELSEVLGAVIWRDRSVAEAAAAIERGEPVASAQERAVHERLELDRQRLRAAEQVGKFGVWTLIPGQQFSWSEELCRIHGVPLDYLPTLDANLSLIHPDDLPVVDAYMAQM